MSASVERMASPRTPVLGPGSRIPAGVKLAVLVLLLLALAAVPPARFGLLAVFGVIALTAIVALRVPLRPLWKRMLMAEPFALSASLLALFRPAGVLLFWTLLAKATLSIALVMIFITTTRFSDTLAVLRRLRFPPALVGTIALLYRYLFVLTAEAERMQRARESRRMHPGRRFLWMVKGGVVARLAIRSLDRAERVYAAMMARGWS